MNRREYLAAITAILGAGCTAQDSTMTKQEAKQTFDDVTHFEPPTSEGIREATRFIDEEAGVVFWAFAGKLPANEDIEVKMAKLGDTDL